MKELKFRVWDKERETLFGIAITYLDSENKNISKFTGLHDKHGKEIFEGDIIKIKDETYRITYNGCFSSFDMTNIDKAKQYKDLYILNRDYQKSEIVGNIYQNRELLYNK